MRQYHPYQDYQNPLLKFYDLPTSPEYLFEDEASRQRRSITKNLTYFTGTGYLSGAVLGGVKGTSDGLRSAERGDSMKLRIARVLNCGGGVGRRFGNSVGILGFLYGCLEHLVVEKRGGIDDSLSCVIAGLGTGAIYRAASGPRSAIVAGAIGGITAAAAVTGKQFLKRIECLGYDD